MLLCFLITCSLADTKSCKDCSVILEELERIDDDASSFGVSMVKNSEKSTAKKYGVTSFPALMYFRNQQPAIFEGKYYFFCIMYVITHKQIQF